MKIPFPKYEAEVVAEIEAYLDMDYQTEITHEEEHGEVGLKYLWARGHNPNGRPDLSTRNENNYARPMFQVITDGAFSGGGYQVTPCMACDRFDRSWACSEHTEIPWDEKKRRWVRPGVEERPTAYYSDHPGDGFAMPSSILESYARLLDEQPAPFDGRRFFTQAVQDDERRRQLTGHWTPPEPQDPNVGRPGYHYHFPTDRWVPDTDDALGDFRAGGEVGGGFLLDLDRVPDGLMGPTRNDFLGSLPSFSMTFEGTFDPRFLEISGDTIQAPASTVRIEATRNDDTPTT